MAPRTTGLGASKRGGRKITRRHVLKTSAAVAGLAAGSGALTGFPTIWAQNIKNVTLLQVGGSYSAIKEIGDQATKDLGFKIVMQDADYATILNRLATQPQGIDIADIEFSQIYKQMIARNVTQPVEAKKIKLWDKVYPIFTKGEYPNGREVSRQGIMPYVVQYVEGPGAKEFHKGPTGWLTGVPTIFNADTLGMRPDLIKRKIEHWKELLDPEFRGKTAILDVPAIGIMDAAMAIESRGDIKYGNKGNMTKAEIDKTIDILIAAKKAGQFRAFWTTFDESVNLMASGEVVLESMWSPAVTAVRSKGIPCYYVPLKEGYRSWGNCLAPMGHLTGLKLEAAYEYFNWYLSGWQGAFVARQGYYSSVPETVKTHLSPAEWDYWYEGKPATVDIKDPYGNLMEKAGRTRDGGSFAERTGNIACWNTVMDQQVYLVQRWNQFVTA
jgi:putative spermidine/putrescine transport system substrate-binding protein